MNSVAPAFAHEVPAAPISEVRLGATIPAPPQTFPVEEKYERAIEECRDVVRRFAFKFRGTAGIDFEDFEQEGYIAVLHAVDTVPADGVLKRWAAMCIRNHLCDVVRKARGRHKPTLVSIDESAPDETPLIETLIGEHARQFETAELQQKINSLPLLERQACGLLLAGYRGKEISRRLRITSTLAWRIARNVLAFFDGKPLPGGGYRAPTAPTGRGRGCHDADGTRGIGF